MNLTLDDLFDLLSPNTVITLRKSDKGPALVDALDYPSAEFNQEYYDAMLPYYHHVVAGISAVDSDLLEVYII